jgi:rubredoxin
MKYCLCPKCNNRQELYSKKIHEMVSMGQVKRFVCDSCGHAAEVVAEKQGCDRVVIFFAMGEIMDDKG